MALNPALMFDFRNQDVIGDYYTFRRSSYTRESAQATRLRGAGSSNYTSRDVLQPQASVKNTRQTGKSARGLHKVKKGETLSAIARKRNTTVNALCQLNHISKGARLLPGQILKYN